ncbi:unnamed protein product [Linum trigynum]|uniref:Retrotransposon gag domain-containing protein n=1 Tax=Linum trigynum TaxID=586398 RepID=A0AAV2DVL3_9ROSI
MRSPHNQYDLSFLEQHLSSAYRAHPKPVLHPPLRSEIMGEQMPGNPPILPTFNGTTDPEDHVRAFCLRMQLQNFSDVALCRTFPSTFAGICLDWYNQLPNGIIRTFEEFIWLFTSKFASQKCRPLHTVALVEVKQEDGESLRTFYSRWSRVAMAVRDLTTEIATHILMESTSNTELRRLLAKCLVFSSPELEAKFEKAITLEEMLVAGSVRRFEPKGGRNDQPHQQP